MPMTLTYGRTEYTVEKLTDENVDKVPYMLTGPRGAQYALFRNLHNPKHLFMVNARKFTGSTPFEWVREHDDGTLEIMR